MGSETKICQNCKKEFVIEPEDFAFYEKIKVPLPTWCPECRLVRRMNFRNERFLYWRECSLCGGKILSIYQHNSSFPVYCKECWWSDKWDPMEYGKNYNFYRNFFEQLRELQHRVPRLNLNVLDVTNSPYCNQVWNSRDIYMCFDVGYGENVIYAKACHFLRDVVDCTYSKKLELCYNCTNTNNSSRSAGLFNCEGCVDSYFLKSCKNCSSCILCSNLRGKNYYILNKPYSKEEFGKIKGDFIDGSYLKYEKAQKIFDDVCLKSINKENENLRAVDCTGNYIWDSKNCRHSFNIFRSENCKFVNDVDSDLKDSMDVSNAAEGELIYNSCIAGAGSRMICNLFSAYAVDVSYSILLPQNNSHLFGCIGLRNKQYCILNKQYSKEEYEKLVPRIIEHMNSMPYVDRKGRVYKYGEFFPPELSPFSYNETIAQEYFPLTKEQAIEQSYSWKDPEPRNYQIDITTDQLPDHIKDVKDDIVGKVIECATVKRQAPDSLNPKSYILNPAHSQCTEAFKIIEPELAFYRRMSIPLPRLCPNCRHYQRLKQRNPLKLWKRQCQCAGAKSSNDVYQNTLKHQHGDVPCSNTFETSYSPDRPEIVYCEQCYLQEVV